MAYLALVRNWQWVALMDEQNVSEPNDGDTVDSTSETPTEAPVSEADFQDEALGPGSPGSTPEATPEGQPASPASPSAAPIGDVPGSIASEFKANQAVADEKAKVGEALVGEREAKQAEKENQAKLVSDIVTEQRLQDLDTADKEQAHKDALQSAQTELNGYEQEVKDFKFHNRFASMSTGSKILATIFSAIGGAASARTGQQNMALAELNHAEEMDFKKQQAELLNKDKFVQWKKQGVTDMESQFNQESARLKVAQSRRIDEMSNYAKTELVKRGASPQEAENNVLVAGLRAKAEKERTDALMKLYQANLKKKAKGTGAGMRIDPNTDAMLAQMAADPNTSPAELARFKAQHYGSSPKEFARADRIAQENITLAGQHEAAAAKAEAHDKERTFLAPDGTERVGVSSKVADRVNQSTGKAKILQEALLELADDVEKNGHVGIGPFQTEASKRRNDMFGNVQAQGRDFMALSSSDASNALEHKTLGGSGAGFEQSASPTVLRARAKKIAEIAQMRADQASVKGNEKAKAEPAKASIPDGTTGTAKDGTPVIRKGGKWVADG